MAERLERAQKNDFEKWVFGMQKSIARARSKGEINIGFHQVGPGLALLRIYQDGLGHWMHITEVLSTSHKVESITGRTYTLPQLIVWSSSKITPENAYSEVYTYVQDHLPQLAGLPINLYLSDKDFRGKRPAIRLEFGKLLERRPVPDVKSRNAA